MAKQRIRKILIANRGEIAVRIIRTCRKLGINTVAVFSEADRTALHVRKADEACFIGPPPSNQSYLLQDRIIEAAVRTGADAIHPGYGFLSEQASFAEACAGAGLLFIGPPPDAIRAMGDKTAARALMKDAGVPMAPGTLAAVQEPREAQEAARAIGYPVLIKAAAGGGGKGMRIVAAPDDFVRSMKVAQSEALSAFGDSRVYLEKYITGPRHIEFQILADQHGSVVHLFERECSIQRRHQKVIEEAPSSVLSPSLREQMGEAAVRAASACGYEGAGTVEFLLDASGAFYFMEMNTRLQVEHPVTEWVTGIDLVEAQIHVAEGAPLDFEQEDLKLTGHAVECRVYAEDPANNFLPDPGTVHRHSAPSGIGIRVDSGIEDGDPVQIHYDPMIAKISTWGRTRAEAIGRMDGALAEYEIAGVQTTIPFCRFVMRHEAFRTGSFDTHFVPDHFSPDVLSPAMDAERLAAIAAVMLKARTEETVVSRNGQSTEGTVSSWARRRFE